MPLEKEGSKIIIYNLMFIDSYRFKSTSLSNLVDNLSGIYDKECKKCMEIKKIDLFVDLSDLKMVDLIINVKNAKNQTLS